MPGIVLFELVFFLLFREHYVSGHDPANFVLMLRYGYDVASTRPHAPGYPGFYVLWSALHSIIPLNEHGIILGCNFLFTVLAIVIGYWSAKKIFDTRTAVVAALFIAFNPLILYYSSVSEIYAYDAFFSAYVVFLLLASPRRYAFLFYFLFGIFGSFRLSSVILTVPVVVWFLMERARSEANWKLFFSNMVAIALGTLCWVVPFILTVGGFQKFLDVLQDARSFSGSFAQNLGIFIPYTIWMANIGVFFIIFHPKKIWNAVRASRTDRALIGLIIVPMLFFIFFCYSKGYALLYIVPFAILLARLIVQLKFQKVVSLSIIGCNLILLFAVPFIAPPVESALNHAHRTSSERLKSFLMRGTSFFAPSLSHIQQSDLTIAAVLKLLSTVPQNSFIVIDNAASLYAYPRSLQTFFSDQHFFMPRLTDTSAMTSYQGADIDYNYSYSKFRFSDSLYYLTISDLNSRIGAPSGDLIGSIAPFKLYRIPPQKREDFIARLRTYFARTQGE